MLRFLCIVLIAFVAVRGEDEIDNEEPRPDLESFEEEDLQTQTPPEDDSESEAPSVVQPEDTEEEKPEELDQNTDGQEEATAEQEEMKDDVADDHINNIMLKPDRVPTVTLKSGREMPMLGLGTYRLGRSVYKITKEALEIGYRLIDTAKTYEAGRGEKSETAIGKAIANSGVPREEIFIITKIMPNDFAMSKLRKAVQDSLTKLRTDYIDLLLIHYPDCGEDPGCRATASYLEGWKNMLQLVEEGIVKDLGISNFFTEEVEKLWVEGGQRISLMQNWLDPYFQDSKTRVITTRTGIQFQAYSVLGAGWLDDGMRKNPILNDKTIKEIASKYQATPAQVVLKWAMTRNIAVIPGTSNSTRLFTNFNSYKLEIDEEDLKRIDGLDGKIQPLIDYGSSKQVSGGGIFSLVANIASKVKSFLGVGSAGGEL